MAMQPPSKEELKEIEAENREDAKREKYCRRRARKFIKDLKLTGVIDPGIEISELQMMLIVEEFEIIYIHGQIEEVNRR